MTFDTNNFSFPSCNVQYTKQIWEKMIQSFFIGDESQNYLECSSYGNYQISQNGNNFSVGGGETIINGLWSATSNVFSFSIPISNSGVSYHAVILERNSDTIYLKLLNNVSANPTLVATSTVYQKLIYIISVDTSNNITIMDYRKSIKSKICCDYDCVTGCNKLITAGSYNPLSIDNVLNVNTQVPLQTTRNDGGSFNGNGDYIIPKTGWYKIDARGIGQISLLSNPTYARNRLYIKVNGQNVDMDVIENFGTNTIIKCTTNCSKYGFFNAGDIIQLWFRIASDAISGNFERLDSDTTPQNYCDMFSMVIQHDK